MEAKNQAAIAEIKQAFEANILALQQALWGDCSGEVFVWPEHWLGVKFDAIKGKSQVVGIAFASVVPPYAYARVSFKNGAGAKAIKMKRRLAIESALEHAQKEYAKIMPQLEKAMAS